jgi:hypothetical protein
MWLCGGIDGGHDKGNALIPILKMGYEEDGGGNF